MCDRHKKLLEYICLYHEELICSQCATEEHSQTPCESRDLGEAADQVSGSLDTGLVELKKLKGISQSILDGRYHESTLRIISETETFLDEFVAEMKRKLNQARHSIPPFSELSSQDRWKLKAVATKRVPNGIVQQVNGDTENDYVREMFEQLKEVKKQTETAKKTLASLPNYVEVDPNEDFLHALKFDIEPVLVSGHGIDDERNDSQLDKSTHVSYNHETVRLSETSEFILEHGFHIAMMGDYFVATVGESVQKRDRKHMSFRQALSISGAGVLKRIGTTTEVAVLQSSGFITVLETSPSLVILYKVNLDGPVIDMDYLESGISEDGDGMQLPVFVTCFHRREGFLLEGVDIVQPKKTKYPGRPPLYNKTSTTIVDSVFHRNKYRIRGISSVCSLQGTSVIVGAEKGVTCVSKTGSLLWTVDIFQKITGLMSCKNLVYVAVEHEQRIMVIGQHGHVMDENILPQGRLSPERMAALDGVFLVKCVGSYTWILFKQTFEYL